MAELSLTFNYYFRFNNSITEWLNGCIAINFLFKYQTQKVSITKVLSYSEIEPFPNQ